MHRGWRSDNPASFVKKLKLGAGYSRSSSADIELFPEHARPPMWHAAVVFLLEAGCTDAEVAGITGQSRDMVEHYARQVNQRRLAAAAVLKWEADEGRRQKRP